jgi:hypothetical protein
VPSSFFVSNIFEGLIWFLLPSALIIINDIMAYLAGGARGAGGVVCWGRGAGGDVCWGGAGGHAAYMEIRVRVRRGPRGGGRETCRLGCGDSCRAGRHAEQGPGDAT